MDIKVFYGKCANTFVSQRIYNILKKNFKRNGSRGKLGDQYKAMYICIIGFLAFRCRFCIPVLKWRSIKQHETRPAMHVFI